MFYTIKAVHNETGEQKLLEETIQEKSPEAIAVKCRALANSTWSYYCQQMNSISIGESHKDGFKTEMEIALPTNLWNKFKQNPQPIIADLTRGDVKINSVEPEWDGIEYTKREQ